MIDYLGIKLGFNISTAVCNTCVGSIQLFICDAVRQTAKSSGLLDIGINISVTAIGDFFTVHNGCETKVFQIIITKLGSNRREGFYCNDIHGINDCLTDGIQPTVFASPPVADRTSIRIIERCVIDHGSKG